MAGRIAQKGARQARAFQWLCQFPKGSGDVAYGPLFEKQIIAGGIHPPARWPAQINPHSLTL